MSTKREILEPQLVRGRDTEVRELKTPSGETRRVYVYPGRLFVSAEPVVVSSVLGSCVAACLWDPVKGIGGMNHFLLPNGPKDGPTAARFANGAMPILVQELLALGARKTEMKAKLFGGASVVDAFRGGKTELGTDNVRAAREFLAAESITLVSEDVGGAEGRKLTFHTADGSATARKL